MPMFRHSLPVQLQGGKRSLEKKVKKSISAQVLDQELLVHRPSTIHLTSTGNSVSEYQDFPFPPMETIVGLVEKIGSLTWGMVLRSILAEI